jgi:hypothetical protein
MALKFAVISLLSLFVLATPVAAQDEPAAALDAAAAPADNQDKNCETCPPPKKYDSQEVIKTTRDVDQSRTINTTTVVPVPPRVRERNHLVIHENETRNIGTILHKNLIIEKEIRYRRRPPVVVERPYVVRQVVVQQYVVQQPCGGCGVPVQPLPCGGCGGAYAPRGYVDTAGFYWPERSGYAMQGYARGGCSCER